MKNLLKDKPLPTGQVLVSNGYSEGAAQTPGNIIDRPSFQEALASVGLREALVAQGVNPQRIAEKIDVLLNAKRKVYEEKKDGSFEKIEEDDYMAIDKGLKHATAIYGITDKPQEGGNRMTYNFIFSAPVQAEVQQMDSKIKELLKHANRNIQENKDVEVERGVERTVE